MPSTIKPKWNFEAERDMVDCERRWEGLSYRKLAALLWFDERKNSYIEYCEFELVLSNFYLDQFSEPDPTEAEIKAAMSEINVVSQRFADCFENLDYLSRRRFGEGFEVAAKDLDDGGMQSNLAHHFFDDRKAFIELVRTIGFAAIAAPIRESPKRRGPKGNPAIKELIYQFAIFYEDNTGRPAFEGFNFNPLEDVYGGPFFEPVAYFLTGFAPDLNLSNHSIGEHIRRAIGDRSKKKA